MSPDELHQLYHRMAPETRTRFEAIEGRLSRHEEADAKRFEGIDGRLSRHEEADDEKFEKIKIELHSKLGKTTFWTIVIILVGLFTSMMSASFWLAWNATQELRIEVRDGFKDINEKAGNTQESVSKIWGKLEPFDFILNDK